MKRFAIFGLGLLAVLLVTALIVPYFIPTSVYREKIETAATEALGRPVTLQGDPKLAIFPSISARIEGVTIANPDGFAAPNMVEAGEIKGSVKLLPLFSKKVEVTEIVLSDATIRLERLKDGTPNWEFETAQDDDSVRDDDDEGKGGAFDTGIDSAKLNNANISFIDRSTGAQYALEGFSASARMPSLADELSSKGKGALNGQAFEYDIALTSVEALMAGALSVLDIELNTDFGRVSYDGELTLIDQDAELNGAFDVQSETIGELIAFLGADLPIKGSELSSIKAAGKVNGMASKPNLSFDTLKLGATGLSAQYKGEMDLTSALPTLNGALELDADQPQRLFKDTFSAAAPLSIIENLKLSGTVNGELDALSLSDLSVRQDSTLLDLSFDGDISLAEGAASNGRINISSNDLPALLERAGQLPSSAGQTKTFSIAGDVSGSAKSVLLKDAALKMDGLSGTGSVGADLSGARPEVKVDLALPQLDLTPFIGADQGTKKPAKVSDEWSDAPISLSPLNTFDADIDIAADRIIAGDIILSDALLKSTLKNGVMKSGFKRNNNAPGFVAFDGNWRGEIVVNAAKPVPYMRLKASADGVAAQKLLAAFTGYQGLTGISGLDVDLASRGTSLKGLIGGLQGTMDADVSNGEVSGVNLERLIKSVDSLSSALQSGNLTVAGFRDAISPEAKTDFSSFVSGLTFKRGVATIERLDLSSPILAVTGSGSIDLANRSMNIRLVPAFDKSAQGQGASLNLDGIPVPVKISGSWAKPSFGLDTAYVQEALTARLTANAKDRLRDELQGLLSRDDETESAAPEDAADAPAQADENDEAESFEDRLLDEALGSIFGD